MENFLQQHGKLVYALLFLLSGWVAMEYSLHYRYYRQEAVALAKAVSQLRVEKNDLTQATGAPGTAGKPTARGLEPGSDGVTTFLARIHEVAGRNGIAILKMIPDPSQKSRFLMEFGARYRPFARMAAELEAMGIILDALQMRTRMSADKSAPLLVSFAVVARDLNLENQGEVLAGARKKVEEGLRYDPFLSPLTDSREVVNDVFTPDLSSRYKLSGIGM
ncbi:MAG: hypothetical protein HQL55_19670, partial [Magnetococcales bacterium]|nr:hypothetical protein [Magnetococcales bacterium]